MNNIFWKIHIFSNLFFYSIVPILFVNFSSFLSSIDTIKYENLLAKNFFLRYIPDQNLFYGNLYTIIASIIYTIIAILYSPKSSIREKIIINSRKIYIQYGNLLYQISIISLTIGLALAIIFGPIDDNLVSQKPKLALYIAYIVRLLDPAIMSYLILFIFTLKKINYKFYLIIILYGLKFVFLGSRSFIFTLVFTLLMPLGFVRRNIKLDMSILNFAFIGFITAFLGNLVRTFNQQGDSLDSFADTLSSVMGRLFINNSIIYIAQSKFEQLNSILLENQPRGIFENIFSFLINRTHINSQYRVLELIGINELNLTSRAGGEHLVSYSFGWLGLSFGLASWYGLIIIFIFYLLIYELQKRLLKNLNLFSLLIYNLLIYIFFESFWNLGLDSISNKIAKGIYSTLFFYVFIILLKRIIPLKKYSIRK